MWEAAWAARVSNDEVGRADAIAWLTSNLETILGLPAPHKLTEFVAHEVRSLSRNVCAAEMGELTRLGCPARPVRVWLEARRC